MTTFKSYQFTFVPAETLKAAGKEVSDQIFKLCSDRDSKHKGNAAYVKNFQIGMQGWLITQTKAGKALTAEIEKLLGNVEEKPEIDLSNIPALFMKFQTLSGKAKRTKAENEELAMLNKILTGS